MKHFMAVTTGVALMAGTACEVRAQKESPPGWQTDYVAARELAKKSGKPLMIVFRCGP